MLIPCVILSACGKNTMHESEPGLMWGAGGGWGGGGFYECKCKIPGVVAGWGQHTTASI